MDYRLRDLSEIELNMIDWRNLRACQKEMRSDCHAAFTVTGHGDIWAFASYGNTPPDWQFSIRTWIPPLDKIADELLLARGGPGRFFISEREYAYWRTEEMGPENPFLRLRLNRVLAIPPQQKVNSRI